MTDKLIEPINQNAEFTSAVGIAVDFGPVYETRATESVNMLRLEASLNFGFIRNTGVEVVISDVPLDIREANVRAICDWFESRLRYWIARGEAAWHRPAGAAH